MEIDVEDKKETGKLTIDDIEFEPLQGLPSNEEEEEPVEEPEKGKKPKSEEEEEEPSKKKKEEEGEEEPKKPKGDKGEEEEEDDDPEDPQDSDEGEDDDERVVDTIIKSMGIEFDEDELEGIEDTEEGISKLVQMSSSKLAEQRYNEMVEQSPNVKALYEYEQRGGDPQEFIRTFYPPVDFSKVEVEEDNTEMQKNIIAESLKSKGLSDERIQRNLQAIEDSGNLLEESKDSLNDLQQIQQQEQERILEENKEATKRQKEQAEQSWNEVEEIIGRGEVSGLPLPASKQKELKNFVTPDPETGISPRDQKVNNMGTEESLAIDLILMYGFDGLLDLVETKTTTKVNGTLKDKLKSSKKRSKNDVQDPDLEKPTYDVEDLEFRIDG